MFVCMDINCCTHQIVQPCTILFYAVLWMYVFCRHIELLYSYCALANHVKMHVCILMKCYKLIWPWVYCVYRWYCWGAAWRSGLQVWLVMWRSWFRALWKAPVVCLVLVGSRNVFEIRACFHNRTKINWGFTEDWLKCQISPSLNIVKTKIIVVYAYTSISLTHNHKNEGTDDHDDDLSKVSPDYSRKPTWNEGKLCNAKRCQTRWI